MKINAIFLSVSLLFVGASAFAQTCKDNILSSHNQDQFIDNADDTVTDVVNALIWQKCALGQRISDEGDQCLGTPTHFPTWQEALEASTEHEGFRLPNIKELGALVERRCINPAINLEAFPSTPSAYFWSNTPDMDEIHADREGHQGRLVDFKLGGEFVLEVNEDRYVRLVKSITTD